MPKQRIDSQTCKMLSLILFRHGKSDWDTDYGNDHNRPLAQRGVRTAMLMGNYLAASGQVPQLALSSSAVRARDTLDLARRQGHWDCDVRIEDALYETDSNNLLAFIRSLDDAPKSLLLTGHEPTCSDMIARLTGTRSNIRFPTGAMARITFELNDWSQVRFGSGELRWLVPPKLLGKFEIAFR